MNTKLKISFLATGLVILSLVAPGAFSTSMPEVAVFMSDERGAYQTALAGAREVVLGADFIEFNMKGNAKAGKRMVSMIKEVQPAVIMAIGSSAARLIVKEVSDVPVVYCFIFNPYELDLTADNVTGVAVIASPESQLEAFLEAMPSLRRIGVLYDPTKSAELVTAGREVAARMGVNLLERQIFSPRAVSAALKDIIFVIDALWLLPDTTVVTKDVFKYLLWATLDNKRPILAFSEGLVKSGSLMAVSPNFKETGKKAGEQINQILRGKNPGQLSLVYPPGEVYVNSHTARTLKINIPRSIIQKAEKVY